MEKPKVTKIIALAGASGSGKSTMANLIDEKYNKEKKRVIILRFDNFYKDLRHLPFEERKYVDFDNPNSLEWPLFMDCIMKLRSGIPVDIPTYDFEKHIRKDESIHIEPADVIVVEGIFALCYEPLIQYYDYIVGVYADPVYCLIRRFKRDIKERSRNPLDVVRQFEEQVYPDYMNIIWPSIEKKYDQLLNIKHLTDEKDQNEFYERTLQTLYSYIETNL